MVNNVFGYKIMDSILNELRCQKDPLTIIGKMKLGKQFFNIKIWRKPLGTFSKNTIKESMKYEGKISQETTKGKKQLGKRMRDLET